MIFNLSQGGESTISVTAPSGANISASISGETVYGTGTCDLKVHVIGTYTVKYTIGTLYVTQSVNITTFGETKTAFFAVLNVTVPGGTISCEGNERTGSGALPVAGTGTKTVVSSYDGASKNGTANVTASQTSYSVSITYSCTVVVSTKAGAFVTISKTGYSSQNGTASNGSITFTVPKSGDWTVTAEYARNTRGATSKTATVAAVYGQSKPVSCYPKYYIFRYGDNGNCFIGDCGMYLEDLAWTSGTHSLEFNFSHGAWKIALYENWGSGNNLVRPTSAINMTGYSKVCLTGMRRDLVLSVAGIAKDDNTRWDDAQWVSKVTLASTTNIWENEWHTYEMNVSSINDARLPVIRTTGGSLDRTEGKADLRILEWWLE